MKQKQEFKEVSVLATETNTEDLKFCVKSEKRTQAEKDRILKTLNECVSFRIKQPLRNDLNDVVVMVSSVLEIKPQIVKEEIKKEIGLNVDNIVLLSDNYDQVTAHNIRKSLSNFIKKFAKTYIKEYA